MPEKIHNVYLYGSRVYGCNSISSDIDIVSVCDINDKLEKIRLDDIDISIYNVDSFLEMVRKQEISVLECLFLPAEKIFKQDISFIINLSLPLLRCSISQKASNSFVKAKKKMTVEKDYNPYIGKKSLFHSLRIIKFGIQIAKYGKIVDYSEANKYWNEIMFCGNVDWKYYKEKYQPEYNTLMTEFRKLAPKL